MRNRILYVKELMPLAGSVAGCILMHQLDFWFERFPAGFYKFQNATEHALYKPGDSWCEELGFSVDEFRTAFDKIGVRHKSKSQYEQAEDKFQGKFYCSYFDRRRQLTYYFRNHALLDHALDQLIAQVPASPSPDLPGAQQWATPADFRREPHRPSVEADPPPADGERPFPVNAESPFAANGQSQDPVNRQSPPSLSRKTPATHLDNPHLQEAGKVHLAFTETTYSEITQRLQQKKTIGSSLRSERARGAPEPANAKRTTSGTPNRITRLPDDFEPNETGVRLAAELKIDVQAELPKFRDHHAAKGSKMLDWQAAWRTWVRNAAEFSRRGTPPSQGKGRFQPGQNGLLAGLYPSSII